MTLEVVEGYSCCCTDWQVADDPGAPSMCADCADVSDPVDPGVACPALATAESTERPGAEDPEPAAPVSCMRATDASCMRAPDEGNPALSPVNVADAERAGDA